MKMQETTSQPKKRKGEGKRQDDKQLRKQGERLQERLKAAKEKQEQAQGCPQPQDVM